MKEFLTWKSMFPSCPDQTLHGTDYPTSGSLPDYKHQRQGSFVLPPGKKKNIKSNVWYGIHGKIRL